MHHYQNASIQCNPLVPNTPRPIPTSPTPNHPLGLTLSTPSLVLYINPKHFQNEYFAGKLSLLPSFAINLFLFQLCVQFYTLEGNSESFMFHTQAIFSSASAAAAHFIHDKIHFKYCIHIYIKRPAQLARGDCVKFK